MIEHPGYWRRLRLIMTEKMNTFTFAFIFTLLGMVAGEIFKGTAISWIITVVGGPFVITLLIIASVKSLGEKEWGSAAAAAGIIGITTYAVWLELSHFQVPEEIDKALNILITLFK